jgi:hypothetical protein
MLPCSSSLAVQMSMCAGYQAAGRSRQMRLQQPWQVGERLQLKLCLLQQCGPLLHTNPQSCGRTPVIAALLPVIVGSAAMRAHRCHTGRRCTW